VALWALICAAELLAISALQSSGLTTVSRWRFWDLGLAKYASALIALYVTLALSRHREAAPDFEAYLLKTPIRWIYGVPHLIAALLAGWLSWYLHTGLSPELTGVLAVVRAAAAATTIWLALLAVAPFAALRILWRGTRRLALLAVAATGVMWTVNSYRNAVWDLAIAATFKIAGWILRPIAGLQIDPANRLVGTPNFLVRVTDACSGMEGAGLMLVFTSAYLWVFRRECRFPHALFLIPTGIVALFVLNAARISALVVIGNAGASHAAITGFHSEAGWLFFLIVALGFSQAARRVGRSR
jgi:exosortase/archaeosortase family protein